MCFSPPQQTNALWLRSPYWSYQYHHHHHHHRQFRKRIWMSEDLLLTSPLYFLQPPHPAKWSDGKTGTEAVDARPNTAIQLHPTLMLAMDLFLLGLSVNIGALVPMVCIKCDRLLPGRAHISIHLEMMSCWHLSTDHLEMPGSLPSLPLICGLLVARLSHLKMYTWELEIKTFGCGNTLQVTDLDFYSLSLKEPC